MNTTTFRPYTPPLKQQLMTRHDKVPERQGEELSPTDAP